MSAALLRTLHNTLAPAGARGRLAVFTFHRVLPEADPLLPDEPAADQFAELADWFAELFNVLPLEEAAVRLRDGTLPARAAAITFDDGYANNLDTALPILSARNLPFTVFLAVEAVTEGIMWNDLIIEAVRSNPQTAREVAARLDDRMRDLPADAGAALAQMLGTLKYLPHEERAATAAGFYRDVTDGGDPPRLMLTPDAVRQCNDATVSFGAHTMRHTILASQPDTQAQWEIAESRRRVAEWTGRDSATFAYPNGRRGTDYGDREVAMVREAGFGCAVSTNWGVASAATNAWELPRLAPWDTTRLRYWLRVVRACAASYRG